MSPPEHVAAYYRSLVGEASDAMLVADANGRYLDANRAATVLLGYSRDELLLMNVADVVAPGPEWATMEYDRFLQEGGWSGELELRRRDGTLVPVEAHASAVQPQGGPPVYLSVIRDISTRRALEQAQQDFLAMVIHELKNPLTAILGQTQLMQRRQTYSAPGLEAIATQARRLQRLIDDLHDIAHFAAGLPELRRSSVDVTALLKEAVVQARTTMPTHAVQAAVPETPLVGWWDGDRVLQVVHNLLTNAGKYSSAGTAITLRLEVGAQAALVSVADHGMGIAADETPHLFERFYRTASAAQSGVEGHGLGLHICKLLVEAHGGCIWVESVLGQGTTVFFTLPYTSGPAT